MYAEVQRLVEARPNVFKELAPARKEPDHLLKVKRTLRIKPHMVKPGSMIGLVSPSAPAAHKYPGRVTRGVEYLKKMGFDVKFARHAKDMYSNGFTSASPEDRANDINEMFDDEHVRAIISIIGGDHASQTLKYLDFNAIKKHPKVFQGYSDTSVLNVAIWKETGLTTFNGPHLCTEIAEWPRMDEYSEEYMLKAWSKLAPIGRVAPSEWWTEEFIDWSGKEDGKRTKKREKSQGWTTLKKGKSTGYLVGGCIESLQHLRGTRYWPDFDGAILFLETSEEKPLPHVVDGILGDYENLGVFDRISGLLFGRPMRYTPEEKQQLRDVILERTKGYDFPIVTDMDFGHTMPMFTLPLGCQARIDTETRAFEITEVAVQ